MDTRHDWLTQQLTEFLAAVSRFGDEQTAVDGAVQRVAEAVEAEVVALLDGDTVRSSIGLGPTAPDVANLHGVCRGGTLEIPGLGSCPALSIELDDGSLLVIARSGGDFSPEEVLLLRGMARVMTLSLRMIRMVETERALRQRSDEQACENAVLLATLQARQLVLERLFRIQQAISRRAPIQTVFDQITEGVGELLVDDVVALRLIETDRRQSRLCSSTGLRQKEREDVARLPAFVGLTGEVVRRNSLVVVDNYAALPSAVDSISKGFYSIMGAPVYQDGQVTGCLIVGSRQEDRAYSEEDQNLLLAFAEHASLALNDSSAREAIQAAYTDAVHQAHHDALTGLPNRLLVLDRIAHALRRGSEPGTLLFVDLDRFKTINDSLGHAAGDEVLVKVAERIQASARSGDTVARLAGDEFVILCEDISEKAALALARRIADAIAEPFELSGRTVVITASVGLAHARSTTRADELLRDADVAMYRAKERGRNRIEVFDQAIRDQILEQLETEQALRQALSRRDLILHYQPTYDLNTGAVTMVEALVRWRHPSNTLLGPDSFIAVAEDTGVILPLGEWVIKESAAQLARWRAAGIWRNDWHLSLNLSARQFTDPGLARMVKHVAAQAGVPTSCFCFEITESGLMEEAASTVSTLAALKRLGCALAIDDFGTGYSSLTYLKRFPVDVLKIDRSFVRGLCSDPEDEVIVSAVISLAGALGLGAVAEGVETSAQLEALRRLGCDEVQGYLLGVPQAPEEIAHQLRVGRSDLVTGARRLRQAALR